MEELYYNRRLLLLNQDVPLSTSISPDTKPPTTNNSSTSLTQSMTSSSSSMFGTERSLQLPRRPIFSSNVAYAFLILFTLVFFLSFILLYIRQFTRDSSAEDSSSRRRRRRRSRHYPSCEGVDPTTAAKSLPAFSYRGDEKQQQVDCAICLEELREGDRVKMIEYCKHVFHPECIDTWLAAHVTCPLCRCTEMCEVRVEGVGSVEDEHGHGDGGSGVENGEEEGREVGSESESQSLSLSMNEEERRSRSSESRRLELGLALGVGDTVALRGSLSC